MEQIVMGRFAFKQEQGHEKTRTSAVELAGRNNHTAVSV
jgi:hypothetical protein